MLKFENKEYRNLQEQVYKNKDDIEALYTKANLANLGIKIVSEQPLANVSDLPLPYGGEYGDGFLVGTSAPYTLYIWTREDNEYNGEWFEWGPLNAPSIVPGPPGETGPMGPTGMRGSQWSSQSGKPQGVAGRDNTDQALDTTTGDVYQFVAGAWQKTGNIRGPQGIQGIQGPIGPQGPQGNIGPAGPAGPQGELTEIVGVLTNPNLLPDPSTVKRSTAYLITVGDQEHLFLIIGAGTSESPLMWHDAGDIGAGSGTKITIKGVTYDQLALDNYTDIPNYGIDSDNPVNVTVTDSPYGSVTFSGLTGYGSNTGGSVVGTGRYIQLPIAETADIKPIVSSPIAQVKRLGFQLTDTYKQSITNTITNSAPTALSIAAPTTATQGTLNEAELESLQKNFYNQIQFNAEFYLLQDRQHDSGYLTYTHVGYDNTIKNYIVKCITITLSTRGWVLTTNKLPVFSLEGETLTITG